MTKSNKVKCLFGKHDLYYSTKEKLYRCTKCRLSSFVYENNVSLYDVAEDDHNFIVKHPYFYGVSGDTVVVCNIKLTDNEAEAIYDYNK